jgi:hypothetical protein
MRAIALIPLLALALALSGCLPVPVVVPERLAPRYLGSEKTDGGMTCSFKNEFLSIEGPHFVHLNLSPRYYAEQHLAILEIRLITTGRHPFMLEPQTLSFVPLQGGPTQTVSVSSPLIAPLKPYEFEVRMENVPLAGMRVNLPAVKIESDTWRPGDLELRLVPATVRPLPFNC